jgi:hypothetical protein
VFVGVGIEQSEADADVAFGCVPECAQDAHVPGGGCGGEECGVELVVGFVDLVCALVLAPENGGLLFQSGEFVVGGSADMRARRSRAQGHPTSLCVPGLSGSWS